jgi:hypothetical protein
MISRLFCILAVVAAPLSAAASAMEMPSRVFEGAPPMPMAFRAPSIAPVDAAWLQAFEEKTTRAAPEVPSGRLRVATVRALPQASQVANWTPIAGGYVARLRASSEGALGLRVKLALASAPRAIEARVQGSDGRIEFVRMDPASGAEVWTPWTEGFSQLIELFTTAVPADDAVSLTDILHFTDSPLAKASAGTCTVPTLCTTNDPVLDAAIAERKKSVARLNFIDGGSGYLCTGTLINTERFPAPFVITANHCINNVSSAASLTTLWFYENVACDIPATNPGMVQLSGGAALVFTNSNADSTLLRMNESPPSGAVYSSWNRALLENGAPIVSLSHPRGDTSRFALGSTTTEYRIIGHAQDFYGVSYSRGIIEGGSSGSGLFTLSGGSLQLRGILSGTTVRQPGGLSCTNLDEEALYGRFQAFEPEIDQYIRLAPQAPDDAPNRALDLFGVPLADPNGVDMPLNLRASPLVFNSRRIDYAGDIDIYRFSLTAQTTVTIGSEGATDTVGALLDSRGVTLETNDDVASGDLNFGITKTLAAGTYYIEVGHWDPASTGTYGLRFTTSAPVSEPAPGSGTNFTDLWWNASESGWGVNINHQGDILFATLFTYDLNGQPMWLVMSNGAKQSDGSWSGTLFRTSGPAFDSSPWSASSIVYSTVGTMRISFSGANAGTLAYSMNGAQLSKSITRLPFSTPVTCSWTTSDRSTLSNYQDLWWNANESGWGVNVTHQGNILFATLFTYDASGKGMWLVMSNGARTGNRAYSGTLYRTTGPAFSSTNWSATPIAYTAVGAMTFTFLTGNSGMLSYSVDGVQVTKSISRLTFSSPMPSCS